MKKNSTPALLLKKIEEKKEVEESLISISAPKHIINNILNFSKVLEIKKSKKFSNHQAFGAGIFIILN